MKNIGFILAILFFAAVGCENNENSDEIIKPDYSHIKEKLNNLKKKYSKQLPKTFKSC